MTNGEIAAASTIAAAALAALATLGTKIIERYKPSHERRNADAGFEADRRMSIFREHAADIANLREMMAARDHHAKLQDAQILAHQKDLASLHTEMGHLRAKLSKLYGAIDESQMQFPETRSFWREKFSQMG